MYVLAVIVIDVIVLILLKYVQLFYRFFKPELYSQANGSCWLSVISLSFVEIQKQLAVIKIGKVNWQRGELIYWSI